MAHVVDFLHICELHRAWCRYVKCMFGKDQDKSTQVKRGSAHNCRIDETLTLDVTGDQKTGQLLAITQPFPSCMLSKQSFVALVSGTLCGRATNVSRG